MVFDTNLLENSLPHPVSSSEIAYLLGWPHPQPRDCGLNKKCLEAAKKKTRKKCESLTGDSREIRTSQSPMSILPT